jgi:multicomponent Na+:H+ antiporter subunit E
VSGGEFVRRVVALFIWAWGVWLLLTWTATAEQLSFGAWLSMIVALFLAPLGAVAAPWRLVDPRRLWALAELLLVCTVKIVRANLALTRRIWAPSRPLESGMLIVSTDARTDAELAATGLISSLVVDNQFVDLDRSEHELMYHTVSVPDGDPADSINRPLERRLAKVRRP